MATLTVENRFPTEVTIIYEGIHKVGPPSQATMGMVPAGETRQLQRGFILSPDIIGYTIRLWAIDPSGSVVWQKAWSFEEFLNLEDVGWKIVVSPETSQ